METLVENRIDLGISIKAYKATLALSHHVETTAIESGLRTLVKIRTAQVNGCAFCIDMHWKEARKHGEPEERLYGLDAWRESAAYTDRERAALAWAEAVTRLDMGHVDDAVYEQARTAFSELDLAELTHVVTTANTWNRLCIAFRIQPGSALPTL
jgi:AhpD family alkylhydroperoxidase